MPVSLRRWHSLALAFRLLLPISIEGHFRVVRVRRQVVSDKIRACVATPYALGNEHILATAGIGASVYRGNGQTADELIERADAAMYQKVPRKCAASNPPEPPPVLAHFEPRASLSRGKASDCGFSA